jgi:hypothetical protein
MVAKRAGADLLLWSESESCFVLIGVCNPLLNKKHARNEGFVGFFMKASGFLVQ